MLDLPEPMAFALALIGPASCPPAPMTLISSNKSSELKEFLLGYIFNFILIIFSKIINLNYLRKTNKI